MRILLTGLCTVHWGRLEYGNIGNYYITETTVRELHRVFPNAKITTTFQMTDEFCREERVEVLPMELFYNWNENDISDCLEELIIAENYQKTGIIENRTPYIDVVLNSDLVIDFSGEMWGDYAEPVGKYRFLTILIKDRVAQLFNKPVILLAGSQGPFNDVKPLTKFAKNVFESFTLVANREAASIEVLSKNGFNVTRVKNYTDVAFLFEPATISEIKDLLVSDNIKDNNIPTIGFVLCGFNMLRGPYDAEPRDDSEFIQFAEAVEYITNSIEARVFLMSHQNGFIKEPNFKLINGRDYPYAKQLYDVLQKRKIANMDFVICAKGPYTPKETKAIIGQFDMFVSGRIHAFVAAVSQSIPTVIINRGHGGKSHRNIGFARSAGLEDYIANPESSIDIISKVQICWNNRFKLKETLNKKIPVVKETARSMFDDIKNTLSKTA
jgi:colanic acid/amylovoran biosynthesis protein